MLLSSNKHALRLVNKQKNAHAWIVVLSIMAEDGDAEREELLNKVVIFVFFAHKMYYLSFVKLQLNHWCHMDYFNYVLSTFLGLGTFQLHCCLCRVRKLSDFIKNIFICVCVPKMNKGLMGLEQYEGE